MKILFLGSSYYKPWLIKAGAEVVQVGPDEDCEIRAEPERVDLSRLVAEMNPGPDVLLLTDDLGQRVLPWDLERLDIIKAYYAVDGPINLFWQRHLADQFDLVTVDQKDAADRLSERLGREAFWLPVAVEPELYQGPDEEELFDFAFVGTIEPQVRPKRSAIIERLSSRYNLKTAGGRGSGWTGPAESARLYRQAKLALNENLFPGVTTRMLEIMASGGCLFTEKAGNGLNDLFREGEHFIAFGPDDLIACSEAYLNDSAVRRAIREQAKAEVLARHSIAARTERLLALISGLGGSPRQNRHSLLNPAWAFLLVGLRWKGQHRGRRLAKARLLFKEALRRESDAARARLGLGLTLRAEDQLEAAALELGRAAQLDEADFTALLDWGLVLDESGRKEEAQEALVQAARLAAKPEQAAAALVDGRLQPGEADFHLAWGLILDQAGQGLWPGFDRSSLPTCFWGGLEHLMRAFSLEPDRIETLTALGRILSGHGQDAFAWPFWERAARLSPEKAEIAGQLARSRRLSYLDG